MIRKQKQQLARRTGRRGLARAAKPGASSSERSAVVAVLVAVALIVASVSSSPKRQTRPRTSRRRAAGTEFGLTIGPADAPREWSSTRTSSVPSAGSSRPASSDQLAPAGRRTARCAWSIGRSCFLDHVRRLLGSARRRPRGRAGGVGARGRQGVPRPALRQPAAARRDRSRDEATASIWPWRRGPDGDEVRRSSRATAPATSGRTRRPRRPGTPAWTELRPSCSTASSSRTAGRGGAGGEPAGGASNARPQ